MDLKAEFLRLDAHGERYGMEYNMPVMHPVEAIALALGVKPEELGLEVHRTPVPQLVKLIYG